MNKAVQPRHFAPGQGKTHRLFGMTLTFSTTASDNGGAYTLCEAIEPPGSGASLHRHRYDEHFVICEGRYEFRLGGKTLALGPGDMAFVPGGTPHGFTCLGPETGRQLLISSPGGIFDAFIEEVAKAAADASATKPAPDFRAIAGRHGIEFVD
jgi:mannose-6-phosphate isomerase-like protein (cupin superfamily)